MAGDKSFEQRFAELAETMISENVPSMREDYIGFQLVEKSEDDTFALGVAAFVLDKKLWVYIPVFFVGGKLRGFDLMFVYQKDLIVPARDNWVSSLKREGVASLGKPSDDKSLRGEGSGHSFYAPGDAFLYSGPYGNKNASDGPNSLLLPGAKEWMKDLSKVNGSLEDNAPGLDTIKLMGKTACENFAQALMDPESTDFANALFRFYSPSAMAKIAMDILDYGAAEKTASDEVSKLEFILPNMKEAADTLTDKEKRLLLSNGVFVRDSRLNFTQVFHDEQDPATLQNPTESGIYDVMMADGKFKRMAVVFPSINALHCPDSFHRSRRPFAGQESAKDMVVIPLEDTSSYIRTSPSEVYGRRANHLSKEESLALNAGLEATKTGIIQALEDSYDHVEVLLVNSAKNTALVNLCLVKNRDIPGKDIVVNRDSYYSPPDKGESVTRVHFSDTEDGELALEGSTLYIPKGASMFIRGRDYYAMKGRKEDADDYDSYVSTDDDGTTIFGKPDAVRNNTMVKEAAAPLQMNWDGNLGHLRFNKNASGPMDRMEVLRYLTEVQGIQAGIAQQLMNRAEREPSNTLRVLLKHAAPYDLAAYADSSFIPFQGGPAAREDVNQQRTEISTLRGQPAALAAYRQSVADEAAGRSTLGIKEVLDVSVIKAMLSLADIGEIRRELLSKMMTGLNAFGR
ncbi:MAG TPA: hypothetical protein VM537_29475, partial [Anaerolineae bacterium]|nr:hypothetical protein [Anaerolineae bacterium]